VSEIAQAARAVIKHREHCWKCQLSRSCIVQSLLLNAWARAYLAATEAEVQEYPHYPSSVGVLPRDGSPVKESDGRTPTIAEGRRQA
jgi:hypothetical protein